MLLAGAALVAHGAAAQDSTRRFGHRAYREAPHTDLKSVGRYRATGRDVQLSLAAANAYEAMRVAALSDSVRLVPISGFRSVAYEQDLFARAIRRHGSAERAARWVAPAGFSEHHTGYAIDIGDQLAPACDTEVCFATTRASVWLRNHAPRFGYELSFPEGHTDISYEPWHWRYIGDEASRKVFAASGAR